ncbi:unnamed protein product [Lactuca saligna]|uniref:Uncharacterized protein n=1 Tax=Lactuca saligna TaxID=75948 RepID=A0AA36A3V4_LACSI|nr:unnamed protein product [Lactuca saligna]
MRDLSKSTLESRLDTISKRSIEIQRITRESDENCINELRMDKYALARFCELIQTRGGLLNDGLATNEERGETVSRYVHRVLDALMHLQEILFVNPMPDANDCTNNRWKWFQGCLGAIDGTTHMALDPEENTSRTFEDMPIGEEQPNHFQIVDVVESSNEWTQWRDDLAQ